MPYNYVVDKSIDTAKLASPPGSSFMFHYALHGCAARSPLSLNWHSLESVRTCWNYLEVLGRIQIPSDFFGTEVVGKRLTHACPEGSLSTNKMQGSARKS